jgi:hypothetical protein
MMDSPFSWQADFVRYLDTLPTACVVVLHSPGGEGKTHLARSRRDLPTELWLHDETGCMRGQDGLSILCDAASQLQKRVVVVSNHAPQLACDCPTAQDCDRRCFGPGSRIVAHIFYPTHYTALSSTVLHRTRSM